MLLYTEEDLDRAYRIDRIQRSKQNKPWIIRSDFRDLYEELLEVYLEKAASHIFEDISLCDMPDWVLNQVDQTLKTEYIFEKEDTSNA
tara:strand:- start:7 stop:270 length:264 start_codon:yes stop_codon:yes gene_type:complete